MPLTPSQELIAVTGATGFIGPVVIRRLVAEGWSVRALARRAPPPGLLPEGVLVIEGDTTDPTALSTLLDGAHTVHHLAGHAHQAATPGAAAEYERVNVAGTRAALDVARMLKVSNFIFYSSISVYGSTDGKSPADERSPLRPESEYARSKAVAEDLVLNAFPGAATVLRLAAVYGPGLKGNYLRLVRAIETGRYVPVGRGLNRRTLVYVDDVAAAAALVTRSRTIEGGVYNITDGSVHALREIVTAIAAAVGKANPGWYVPVASARLVAGLLDMTVRPFRSTTSRATHLLAKYLEDSAVRGDKIQEHLGFRPVISLAEGWERTLDGLRRDRPG